LAERLRRVAVLPQLVEVGAGQGIGGGLDPRPAGLRSGDRLHQARQVVGVGQAVADHHHLQGGGPVGSRCGGSGVGLGGGDRAGDEQYQREQQACEGVHFSSWAWLWAYGSTLPGWRIPSGSNSRLTPRISASASVPRALAMNTRLARPMPCSPDRVPPSSRASANTSGSAACAARDCPALPGSYMMSPCRLPLRAWPKVTIGRPQRREIACTPATSPGIRDTGTTTSSLILLAAIMRSAGDSALRADHRRSRAAVLPPVSMSSRPSTVAASPIASSAAGRASGSPSASSNSIAPTPSGRSAPPTSRARRTLSPSMNSTMDGTTGCAINRATAVA